METRRQEKKISVLRAAGLFVLQFCRLGIVTLFWPIAEAFAQPLSSLNRLMGCRFGIVMC